MDELRNLYHVFELNNLEQYLNLIESVPINHTLHPSNVESPEAISTDVKGLPSSNIIVNKKARHVKNLKRAVSCQVPDLDRIFMDFMKGNQCPSVSIVVHEP
jgi:hypothetical protein